MSSEIISGGGSARLAGPAAGNQQFSRRAFVVGGAMGAVGLTLAGRMAYLSIWQGEKYALLAEGNRVSLRLIPPRRGWIVDRQGKPLALNQPDYRLELIPEAVTDLDATLAAVGKVLPLTAEDIERIRSDVARQPKYMPVEIAHGLSWPTFAAINVNLPDLPGVQPLPGFLRVYPGGDHFAHLIGYVGTPTPEQFAVTHDPLLIFPGYKIGKDGIERRADARLRGTAGARRVEVNARGRVIRDLDTRADIPGKTLRLTIDRDLQNYAARRLTDNSASVVVMDCATGDVLCMVSMPAYDPNAFSTRVTAKLWAELQADDHHPLINKSAQGLYPPGSTFKTMTALAILGSGISADAACNCTGTYRLGNAAWHCWSKRGHGRVDLHKAIPQSCDVYFYTFGRAVGVDAIAATAHKFGLGQKFDLPLPGQSAGIIPNTAWKLARYKKPWGIGDTLNTSIGQGYIVANPLQLAVMAARLASGNAVEPRLFADDPHVAPPPLDIPPEHLAVVRTGMTNVVNSPGGSGKTTRLLVDGIQMAGKTGSAQVRNISKADRRAGRTKSELQPWKYRDHGLFVAFAPADAPKYAISVVLEHGNHGAAAGIIARDVMTYLFEPERAMATLAPLERAYEAKKAAALAAAEAAAKAASMPVDAAAVAASLTPDSEPSGPVDE
ncbi:penicillin-binding protein 2 [Polymorphobacter sp. PAMC 29334]|uniref:penicillin-binding protein 2 n=1 Tax=Polymorphobacter sp. PAMC 29334 TaxID=2862331 RepID=UPI001C79973D|nr:penicillin-binding protein 2 [Polymorphobacter sp. PAMC 29334]QYE33953.1 penicillin-binding protein 2 [Polymorphobacter sp. PAMC 29334]